MCDSKLQLDCDIVYVVRIQVVKTENPSASATVNCKLWK
jgi:hypothetical protein